HFAPARVAADDSKSSAVERYECPLFGIKMQRGFSIRLVRPVAGETPVGEDWSDVPVELGRGRIIRASHYRQRPNREQDLRTPSHIIRDSRTLAPTPNPASILAHFSHIALDTINGFTIGGRDRKLVSADARIESDTVVVSSPDVPRSRGGALRLGRQSRSDSLHPGRPTRLSFPD